MSNPIAGQISFEGRLVSSVQFELKALTMEELPDGLTWPDVGELTSEDYVEVTVRCKVLPAHADEKIDYDSGVGSGALKKKYRIQPLRSGFRVNSILKADDLERAWERSHTA